MTDLEKYIHSTFGISREEMGLIADLFKPEKLERGDFYLRSGQLCDKLSFIHAGLLRIYVTKDNKEVTQWISVKDNFVTDLASLMFRTDARWNIQALTDCELYTISGEDYHRIGKLIPKWHELEKLFIAKCFTYLEERVLKHLSMSAEERYLEFFSHNKHLFNEVPLQYIASMLGMSPETFSRIRKKQLD